MNDVVEKMNVKVVSDGTPWGTKVYDAKSGEPIEHLRAISFSARAGEIPTVTMELMNVEIELTAQMELKYRDVPPSNLDTRMRKCHDPQCRFRESGNRCELKSIYITLSGECGRKETYKV